MNQKLSIGLFVGGLATFLTSLGNFIGEHDTWQSVLAPSEVGHIMLMTATFCMTIAGALGTHVRFSKNSRKTDRVDMNKIESSSLEKDCE